MKSRWTAGGAILAAAMSSACCWVPLLLVGMGASAGGAGAAFEAYRWPLLALTGTLLSAGFYMAYRKPACASDSQCAPTMLKNRRLSRLALWGAAVIGVLTAAFPSYVGLLFAAEHVPETATLSPETIASPTDGTTVVRSYTIQGMSCAGCESHVREALQQVPEIRYVEVAFAKKHATVHFRAQSDPKQHDKLVYAAIEDLGYTAQAAAKP